MAKDLDDDALGLQAKNNWMASAKQFLNAAGKDKGVHTDENAKIYRRKTYEWLLAVNNTLSTMSGMSLDDFIAEEAGLAIVNRLSQSGRDLGLGRWGVTQVLCYKPCVCNLTSGYAPDPCVGRVGGGGAPVCCLAGDTHRRLEVLHAFHRPGI